MFENKTTRKIEVGIISYYNFDQYIKPDNKLKIYQNWNKAWKEVFRQSKKNKINLRQYNSKQHAKYDKIIFVEIPRLNDLIKVLYANIYKKRISTILIVNETFLGRARYMLRIPFLFNEILINCEENINKFMSYKTKNFSYPSVPSKEKIKSQKSIILNSKRKNKLVFISSFKIALSNHGSYKFRYKLVKDLLKYKNFFKLYGYGWDKVPLPFDIIGIAIILRNSFLKKLVKNIMKINYKPLGKFPVAKSKEKTLENYDFALAIEPTVSKFNSICEKIFDPMISGSIPVYYGQDLSKNIPSNAYIKIYEKTSGKEIVEKLQSLTEQQKKEYRKNIYKFLNSDEANKYRYSNYAKIIINMILI